MSFISFPPQAMTMMTTPTTHLQATTFNFTSRHFSVLSSLLHLQSFTKLMLLSAMMLLLLLIHHCEIDA